jgi:Family of unknown function (DUF6152)
MKKMIALGLAVVASLTFMARSYAHHSTNLWYDVNSVQTLQGVLVDLLWINPHVVMHVDVAGPDGKVQTWSVETHPTAVLARAGWRPTQFKAGDKLTIIGNPSRKGLNTLSLLEVKTDDGRDFKVNAAK